MSKIRWRRVTRRKKIWATVDGRDLEIREKKDGLWTVLVDGRVAGRCHDEKAARGFAARLPRNEFDPIKARKAFYAEVKPRWGLRPI